MTSIYNRRIFRGDSELSDIESNRRINEFDIDRELEVPHRHTLSEHVYNYVKRLSFLYALCFTGYFYLHFIILSHNESYKIDFTKDDGIFFGTLPIICAFPINHILSKKRYKHYLTYILGFFNGVNFSFMNNIGTLNEFALNTRDFKKNDDIHLLIFWSLIVLGIYSISYALYITKRKILVSALILTPIVTLIIYCSVMTNNGYIIHIHHYLIGLFLLLVSYHPKYITLIINSVSLGVYLEGIVQWGYAPIIYKN